MLEGPPCGRLPRPPKRRASLEAPVSVFARRVRLRPYRLADEDDLARGSGFKNFLVCARGFSEWHFLANDRAQRAVFEPRNKPGVDVCLFGRRDGPKRERE